MILNFPFTKGGNKFCDKDWTYNDMNGGFTGLASLGVTDVHPTFGTSPNFFGGNCDKVGWNKETGFGLVIGGSPTGEIVYGIYLDKDRLTPIGIDMVVKQYGIDAMGVEPEPEEATEKSLSELRKEAKEKGIPSRFYMSASKAEVMELIGKVDAGEDFSKVTGQTLAVEQPESKAYDEKASVSKSRKQ